MIFVLKGVDASNRNVGKITLPSELDSDVINVVKKLGRFSIGSDEFFALNTFVQELKKNGIWNKIGSLFIPYFSNTVANAYYDMMSAESATFDTNSYVFSQDNGITIKPNVSKFDAVISIPNSYMLLPSFYVAINKNGRKANLEIADFVMNGSTSGNVVNLANNCPVVGSSIGNVNSWSSGLSGWGQGIEASNYYVLHLKTTDGVSANGSKILFKNPNGGVKSANYNDATTSQASGVGQISSFTHYYTASASEQNITSIVIIGKSILTDDEANILAEAVNKLYNSILV